MSYEQEFMKEFEAWVNTQIMINDMAHKESQKSLRRRPRRACQRCHNSLRKPLGCLSVLAW